MAILKTQNVNRIFGSPPNEVYALRDVNIEIAHGELLGMVGPSGSGKSTLLHILGGVEKPTSGRVLLEGEDLASLDDDQRAILRRRRIGFVFQRINLLPTLTALENVVLPLMIDGIGHEERTTRATQLLATVGMSHRERSFPATLSGGEQQRIAIARALVTRPAIVLADEPTGALDSANGRKITDLLRQLSRDHQQTVVIVTHDPLVAALTDRQVTVLDGRVHLDREVPMPNDVLLRET